MENFKIDNEKINNLCKLVDTLQECIQKDVSEVKNESADVFSRFMAFSRLDFYLNTNMYMNNLTKKAMVFGHALNHEVFKTEKHNEHGWHTPNFEQIKFFESPTNREDDDSEIPDVLKKIIAGAILKKMFEETDDH